MSGHNEDYTMKTSVCLCLGAIVLAVAGAARPQDPPAPKTWTVSPGQSIQEAIDKAVPGDTVQVLPGVAGEVVGGRVGHRCAPGAVCVEL